MLKRILILAVISLSGCAAMDQWAHATTQPGVAESQGAIGAVVTGNPAIGLLISNGLSAAATLYLFLRKKKWKDAFTTVVTTIEPFIPQDPPQRRELEAAQGEAVTKLVKQAKADA
jgi:hypothetical protein